MALLPAFATAAVSSVLALNNLRTLKREFSLKAKESFHFTSALILSAMIFYVFFYNFVAEPLGYILHSLDHGDLTTRQEVVTHTSYKRRCHHMAALPSNHLLLNREVCGISRDDAHQLRSGGALILRGFSSRYGFSYLEYEVAANGR